MAVNSCAKGKRIERAARDFLNRYEGVHARRGQQFAGGNDSPDLVVDGTPGLHWEVKSKKKLKIGTAVWRKAIKQSISDAPDGDSPLLLWRHFNSPFWLITECETLGTWLAADWMKRAGFELRDGGSVDKS